MFLGRTDSPCEESTTDQLDTRPYAVGLARFVQVCETPLTIGIQGEWGSGKTSLMRIVKHELEKTESPLLIHWFDTWQYGALGDDDTLGLQLLIDLTTSIGKVLSENAAAMRTTTKLLGVLTTMSQLAKQSARVVGTATAAGVTNYITGGLVDGGTLVGGLLNQGESERPQIGTLRDGFQRLVEHFVEQANVETARVVVFVDDLDRIRPGRAVALLEVLKNFLEVPHCVFVIACDYDVVREGVRERLGIDDRAKVDAFFEKLFQVPFQMPVDSYTNTKFLQSYVEGLLSSRLTGSWKSKRRHDLAMAVTHRVNTAVTIAIGTNPRVIKRFFNVSDLLLCVEEQRNALKAAQNWEDEHFVSAYLSVVAMHNRWPDVTSYMAGLKDTKEFASFLATLLDAPETDDVVDEELEGLLQSRYAPDSMDGNWKSAPEIQCLGRFAKALVTVLDQQPDGHVDEKEFEVLKVWLERLRLSSATTELSYKTGFFKFRETALRISPDAGDAFMGLIRALDAKYTRNPRYSIVRTDQKYYIQLKNDIGSQIAPMSFYTRDDPPQLLLRLNLGKKRAEAANVVDLHDIGEGFIERTRAMGVPWVPNGEGYRLDFAACRPPQNAMSEFRHELLELFDRCVAAVAAAERTALAATGTPQDVPVTAAVRTTLSPPGIVQDL